MKKILGWLALIVLAGAALWAATAWPRLNVVETGRTPEYPTLQDRTYSASPDRVGAALRDALSERSRWRVVGSGQGPGGTVLTAVHETPVFRLKDDVTVKVRRKGGKTVSGDGISGRTPATSASCSRRWTTNCTGEPAPQSCERHRPRDEGFGGRGPDEDPAPLRSWGFRSARIAHKGVLLIATRSLRLRAIRAPRRSRGGRRSPPGLRVVEVHTTSVTRR
jgi:hypothetical protein